MTLDERHMQAALALAAKARGRTRPNPMVGAVVVKAGRIVGAGYHHRAGQPHAEIVALGAAGPGARGATLYVTLEPCRHTGRTPPCTRAIAAAGIRQVVAAMTDPNPRMQGRGLRELRAAGIATRVGVLQAEAERLNEVYLTWRRRHRPFVTVKVAQSLDGKIATRTGSSRWISGAPARQFVHQLRAQVDAIVVGVRTVLADDPRLTVRTTASIRLPLKIVLDDRLRTPLNARLLRGRAPVVIATTPGASAARRRALERRGAEVAVLPARHGRVDLRALLRLLAHRDITHLLVEGGGEVITSFVEAGLVDRWISILAPILVGGPALTPMEGKGIARLRDAPRLRQAIWRALGHDLMIDGRFT